MNDFLLSIDTEASGLPKKWDLPYSAANNWPNCVQISWIIYTRDGAEVKRENHFINNTDFEITKSALKVHGITRSFLDEHGKSREFIMQLLAKDYLHYRPLVFGHFMEFDLHMIGVDFYRTGIENPIKKEDTFCTMLATTALVKNPALKFFRLGELYEALFHVTLADQHSALVDAKATADCFFELYRRGEITEQSIEFQRRQVKKKTVQENLKGCTIPFLFFIILNILIYYYL